MDERYLEEVKNNLLLYKYNPDHREELLDKLYSRKMNRLLMAMMELFDRDIDNFKYDDENEITYIFSLMELLPDVVSNNKHLQETASYRLTELHTKIRELIHHKPLNMSSKQNSRYKLLKNILVKLEDTIIKLQYDIPPDYDPNKEEFISYIIFNSKNINHLYIAVSQFPYIINIMDKNEQPLFNRVIDEYLKALDEYTSNPNLGPIDDLIYYKRVINTILSCEKLILTDDDKKMLIDKLQSHLDNFKYEVTRQKEKHTYFINAIIMKLMDIEEENTVENLNYEYEVHDTFKATHNEEARKIYILNSNVKGEESPRKIYTFDGPDAKELDDGLSISKQDGLYHLGVHIANPIKYIGTDSILYDEAKKRTRSIYFGNECIPMFPFNLSGDTMSLNEGKYTHAINHNFYIDEYSGELVKYEIDDKPIRVTKNKTYADFNESISHGNDDEDYFETLLLLSDIAPILGKVYNEDSVYQEFHNDNSKTLATSVVEKCMIYTNYNLAKLFNSKNLPYIYRCHEINEKEIKEIEDIQSRITMRRDNKDLVRDLEMLKNIFPRAYYTSENKGHIGLGTDYYSHTTSPLRRIADDISIECIYKFILGEYTKEDIKRYKEYIDMMSEQINAKRRTLDNYELERMHRQ